MDPKAPKKPGGKKYWWAGGIVCLLVVAGLLAGWIYVAGHQVWTDGRDIASPVSTANVRQVLWSTPEPMTADFNTPGDEYEICLSSDSNELYFVRGRPGQGADIFTSRRTHNEWSKPLRLDAVNSKYDELGPRLSADGRLLLFYSNRPGGIGGYDVWVALRTEGLWGKPVNLGPNVNSTHNEYGPSITADNRRLYFASNRKAAERMGKRIQWKATIRQGQLGDYDLFSTDVDFSEALPSGTATSQPTTAPSAGLKIRAEQALELQGINTPHNEGTPCVSPWGDFLYFASNRPGGRGGFDLYRARIEDGRCLRLENLGAEVNTAGNETDPQLAKGGFMLYFSSDRDGGDEGTYDLYTSESHEVYASRVGRPLPTLGWSIWVLLASLALLIPLMLFLRAGGYKHLSMLQKCFAVALLLHLLLTLMLSLAQVSQEIYQYVVDEPDEVELDLAADKQLEVRTQIRHQLADLAPAAPSQTEIARLDTEPQPVREVERLDMNVPEAQRRPVEYIFEPDKPKDEPKVEAEQVATPTPTVHMSELVIKLTPPEVKIRGVETKPQTTETPPSANQTRQRSAIVKTTRPDATRLPTETTKPVPDTLAHVAEVSRPVGDAQRQDYTPTPRLTEMSIALSAPKRGSNPIKEAPSAGATPVNVAEPTGAERKQAAASAARAGSARVKTPTVQADSDSLMAEPGPIRMDRPVGDAVARADIPTPKVVDVALNLGGPKIKSSKVKAAQDPTDIASADKPAGSSRAAAARPTSTAGSAKLAVPSAEPTGKSLAMTGSPADIAKPLGKVSLQVALPAPAIAAVVVSPSSPKIKAAAKQAEASPASSAAASLKSLRAPAVRSTGPTSKADLARLSVPTVRSSEHSLASAITVTHQVAKASEPSVSVNIPLPSDAPEVGPPTLPASVVDVHREAAVPQVAAEAATAGIGKIAAAATPPAGPPRTVRSNTQTHNKPPTVSVVQKIGADRPGRTAYTPQADLARPLVAIGPIGGKLGPQKIAKPEIMFHRKFEQRQRLLKDMGGTKASEAAVARALLYLSRTQEKDGAWGLLTGRSTKHKRKSTDVAMTGLSALCFLAGDHTPTKNGPYRDTVTRAIDFLIDEQRKDGSLWQHGGRMYGHAIATLALSEAAIMTGDSKYRQAAIKGAQFIIKAQNMSTGGWRYEPRKSSDTSVLGWCVMALYSVQQMGMELPPETFRGAAKWLDKVGGGRTRILCGYTDRSPKPAMSAEGAFSRILLGQKLSDAQQKELADYMNRHKGETAKNFYLAYYGSLAMMQLGGEAWQQWNSQMRERLVALQTRGGSRDGAWTTNTAYSGNNGGIVYTTTMAALTLEVYYRYLPMLGGLSGDSSDPGGKPNAPESPKPLPKKRR